MRFTPPSVLAVLALVSTMSGCATADQRVIDVAEAAGYHDVAPFRGATLKCGDHTTSLRRFTATTADGRPVQGVVCCNLFGGCTIRY